MIFHSVSLVVDLHMMWFYCVNKNNWYSIWCIVCNRANICVLTALQLVVSHQWSSGFSTSNKTHQQNNHIIILSQNELKGRWFSADSTVMMGYMFGNLGLCWQLFFFSCLKPHRKDVNDHSVLYNVSQTFISNALLITTVLLCCMLSVNHPLTAIIDSV